MRKIAILSSFLLLSLTTTSSVMASDGVTVKFNNYNGHFVHPQESKMENGQLLVPIRWVAEQLGVNVTWNNQNNEIEIDVPESKSLTSQINSLTYAVISTDPKEVVNTWIDGVKKRSGALQYAVMSPELQKETYNEMSQSDWVTGGSSLKMTNEQLQEEKINDKKLKYILTYDLKDSGGIVGKGNRTIIVEKDKGGQDYWWVTEITTTDKSDVWLSPGVKVTNQLGYKDSMLAFSELEARELVVHARHHYWNLSSGGSLDFPGPPGPVEDFPIEGKGDHYRWIVDAMNTKEKYLTYLDEVFTPEKVEQFWNEQTSSGSIVEVNGRLAQPNADGGSLAQWENAKVTLIDDNGPEKSYQFDVPIGDNWKNETHKITFRYVQGEGWRVDQHVQDIR